MKRAVVTGGAGGLGLAVAHRLRRDGVDVKCWDLQKGDTSVDVTDRAQVLAAAELLGDVDILVNSAGIVGPNLPILEAPLWLAPNV